MTLLALVDDLGVRRDRAAPRLEPGNARQLILVQRKEPVQLLDQGARARCHGLSVLNHDRHGRGPATHRLATGHETASLLL